MVLFVLYKVLTFESVDEILWCYHSNETSSAVFSHGTTCFVCGFNFWVCVWNPMVWPFKWNLVSSSFTWNHLSFSIVQKKMWKFFLVVFSIWSLLKSGSRASLRVQHISKLKKNAIKWPGYFTLCCSPQTDLKMNSCWVHLLKCWFFCQPPATAPPPSSQTDSVAVKQEKTVSFKTKFAPFIFRHFLGWLRCDGITFQKLCMAMLIKISFAFR